MNMPPHNNEHPKLEIEKINELVILSEPKNAIVLFVLFTILQKVCHKGDACYYFDQDDETEEAGKYITKWSEVTQKLIPLRSVTYFKQCHKKIYIYVKHLCEVLKQLDIILTSESMNIQKDDGKKTCKIRHYVNGLPN